jgi:hypothetical protein
VIQQALSVIAVKCALTFLIVPLSGPVPHAASAVRSRELNARVRTGVEEEGEEEEEGRLVGAARQRQVAATLSSTICYKSQVVHHRRSFCQQDVPDA